MSNWTDQFVGDRMAVDREFNDRIRASEFSSQEWGTIMTAVEFRIENPDDPQQAQLVADTSKIDQVMPALEEMQQQMGAMGGGGGGGSGGSSGGGLFGSIKDSLGLGGGGGGNDRTQAAAALADEYAREFQDRLESGGKWERACSVAATGTSAVDDADAGDPAAGATDADSEPTDADE